MRSALTSILVIVLAAIAIVFALSNQTTVPVDLIVWQLEPTLPLLLVSTLIIGWLLGLISLLGLVIRLYAERRQLRRQVELADTEIRNLRSIPLQDAH